MKKGSASKNTVLKISLPKKFVRELTDTLEARDLTIDEIIRMYLRSFLNGSKKFQALAPDDPLPFGKYKDTPLGTVIKSEPNYIAWCLTKMESFQLTGESTRLLEAALGVDHDEPSSAEENDILED